MATTYTRELHQDILERLQMQAFVCNATPSTPPAINILEALALLAEIDRLTAENKKLAEAREDGYADAICDVEGVYEIDRAEVTATRSPYKEEK